MTPPAPDAHDRFDRYLAGELSPSEQRDLAHAALDDPELFDALTTAAALKAELGRTGSSHGGRRVARIVAGLVAAAAVIVLAIVYRPASVVAPSAPAESSSSIVEPGAGAPASSRPIVLGARVDPAAPRADAFRAADGSARSPRTAGSITSVSDGVVEVDLGSVDGLEKGASLTASSNTGAAASVIVETVFRERFRGRVSGQVHVGDRVKVPARVHVAALMQQADAGIARGDLAIAISSVYAAAQDVEAAPETGTEYARVGNEIAAALINRDGLDEAERILRRVQPRATGVVRMRIANNLGAIAALRGDRASAEALYSSALAAGADSTDAAADRQSIQRNLDAVRVR